MCGRCLAAGMSATRWARSPPRRCTEVGPQWLRAPHARRTCCTTTTRAQDGGEQASEAQVHGPAALLPVAPPSLRPRRDALTTVAPSSRAQCERVSASTRPPGRRAGRIGDMSPPHGGARTWLAAHACMAVACLVRCAPPSSAPTGALFSYAFLVGSSGPRTVAAVALFTPPLVKTAPSNAIRQQLMHT